MKLTKKHYLFLFAFVVLFQLVFIAKRIFLYEEVKKKGRIYKFEIAQRDPADMFRGRYLALNFIPDKVDIPDTLEFERGEKVWLELQTDSMGFAKPYRVYKHKLHNSKNLLQVKVRYVFETGGQKVMEVQYPFERYYLNEFKAGEIEKLLRLPPVERQKPSFIKVKIWKGKALIDAIFINGKALDK